MATKDLLAMSEKELKKHKTMLRFKRQFILQLFAWMGLAFMLVFNYIPMTGIIIAFKNYKLTDGLMGFLTSEWVGMKWFIEFYNDIYFWPIIRNTINMSLWKLVFTFPMPILFALVLDELHSTKVKKVVQTVSYLPHFISWVVVSGLIFSFLNEATGLFNQLFLLLGIRETSFSVLASTDAFIPIVVVSDVWKEMGWWAIIFLAAIAGVDVSIYEAAKVDGAGRLRRIWNITLPSIKGTVIIVLILSIGNLFGGGISGSNFDQAYMLGNSANYSVSEIIQTYALDMGLAQGRYSYATALGLIQSVISLCLIILSNTISTKLSGTGLF